jgi:hypothetical protein
MTPLTDERLAMDTAEQICRVWRELLMIPNEELKKAWQDPSKHESVKAYALQCIGMCRSEITRILETFRQGLFGRAPGEQTKLLEDLYDHVHEGATRMAECTPAARHEILEYLAAHLSDISDWLAETGAVVTRHWRATHERTAAAHC